MRVTWKEGGFSYQVRVNTRGALTRDDLLRIANSLEPVK